MICMASDRTATQALLDWWHGKRGERAMPSRAELDPIELKAILPNLLLIDVAPAPNGSGHVFSCRLAGTELDEREPGSLERVFERVVEALRAFEGPEGIDAPMAAHIVVATK